MTRFCHARNATFAITASGEVEEFETRARNGQSKAKRHDDPSRRTVTIKRGERHAEECLCARLGCWEARLKGLYTGY